VLGIYLLLFQNIDPKLVLSRFLEL